MFQPNMGDVGRHVLGPAVELVTKEANLAILERKELDEISGEVSDALVEEEVRSLVEGPGCTQYTCKLYQNAQEVLV